MHAHRLALLPAALILAGAAFAQEPPKPAPAVPMLPGVPITAPTAKPADAEARAAAAAEAEAAEAQAEAEAAAEAETPEGTPTEAPAARPADGPRSLYARVEGADGRVMGQASLTELASGLVYANLMLENLPAGIHAVHLHEAGACEVPEFASAGGHIAGGRQHGILNPNGPHPGDMPNIWVQDSGIWQGDVFLFGLKMDDVADGDGSAIVIHEGADDYYTDPDGDAGPRIACGVFGAASN